MSFSHKYTYILLLADLKNQPVGSSCVTNILAFCSYFKGQEQTFFNHILNFTLFVYLSSFNLLVWDNVTVET